MLTLITGCGGYIGAPLARALRVQGRAVRGFDRDEARLAPLAALGVETIIADTGDPAALRAAVAGAEVVYHLAGSPLGTPATIIASNVEGARNIAAACGPGSGVRALVFASSGALYPSGPAWLDEETRPAPAFGYARAKYLAEQLLLEAHRSNGVPAVIARIAAVYGPGSPALMVGQVRRGRFPLIGGGKGFISSIHIDDTVAALLALAERGTPGRIYNLADDEPTTVRELYSHLARLLDAPPPPSISPIAARALLALAGLVVRMRGGTAGLPPDLVEMASVSHRMSNRRMREELGIVLRYRSYRDGMPTCVST